MTVFNFPPPRNHRHGGDAVMRLVAPLEERSAFLEFSLRCRAFEAVPTLGNEQKMFDAKATWGTAWRVANPS